MLIQWSTGIHREISRVEASLTSPYIAKQLTALFRTQPPFCSLDCQRVYSTNDKLRILVKAQPSTRSTWPQSQTRLGIRPRDLGLLNKYSLSHCGLFAASRHKLAFTRRHYALLTGTDTTALFNSFLFFVFFEQSSRTPRCS